ncbi:MAG TPA: hypothetical protein VK923_20865, partial [Euzebyales bacterium]|nr:hypothetical protein [Euzebyales bacterium]
MRGTIAQVGTALLAGGAAAWAALAAWGQLQDNRKEAEAAREDTDEQLRLSPGGLRLSQERTAEELRLSREAVVLSRDAQLVDRFTRAVANLATRTSMCGSAGSTRWSGSPMTQKGIFRPSSR